MVPPRVHQYGGEDERRISVLKSPAQRLGDVQVEK